jgi:hypothetical protein
MYVNMCNFIYLTTRALFGNLDSVQRSLKWLGKTMKHVTHGHGSAMQT